MANADRPGATPAAPTKLRPIFHSAGMRRKDGAAVVGQASDATTDWLTADPDEALRIVARGDRRDALVDFDETLWLRSSTEVYLASLRPRLLAFLVLTALDVLRPWRWLPGDRRTFLYRDWIRVSVTSLLLPWSLLLWRRQAKGLGRRWQNGPLVDALLAGGYDSVLVGDQRFPTGRSATAPGPGAPDAPRRRQRPAPRASRPRRRQARHRSR